MKRTLLYLLASLLILIPTQSQATHPPVIKVGLRTSIPPRCFTAWRNGKLGLRGKNIDLLTQLSHHMGVRFEYVKCDSVTMEKRMLREGKIHFTSFAAISDDTNADITHIPVGFRINARLFVNDAIKTVVCTNDLAGKRVTTIRGGPFPDLLAKIDESQIIYTPSPLESLQILNKGLADVFVAPAEDIAQYLIQREGLTNIRRVGIVLDHANLGMAVLKKNQALIHELTLAMAWAEETGVIQQIEEKWQGITFNTGLREKILRYLFPVLGLTGMILLAVFGWNYQLKRKVQQMTAKLEISEKKYRNLIESSPDMIFLVDRKGTILHANKEAQYLLPDEESKWGLAALLPSNERGHFTDFLDQLFSGQALSREFHLLNPNGSVRDIDLAATLMPHDVFGESLACCFARDVTERNRIERDLGQADRMMLIGQMAAEVAHEINNPIGIIRANIDLILARGWHTPEAKEFLLSSQRNTVRAGAFTRDLLAMARPKPACMGQIELWDLVEKTLEMLGAPLKGIEVITRTRGERASIWGDWNQLQQVLVNLLVNATAAVKKSGKTQISVTCCVPKGAGMARLRVEDQGVGIPKEQLTEIFEPFFTHGKKGGMGLGLFISRRIIESHQGMIYAESNLNRGSEFVVELPLMPSSHDRSQSGPEQEQHGEA